MREKNSKWIILLLLALVWGSSFILMKRGMEVFSSEQVAALRIVIAFLFLLPFCAFQEQCGVVLIASDSVFVE